MNNRTANEPVLEVRDLNVRFGAHHAVRDVSLSLHRGRTLAMVGESGSGKSVASLALMGLLPRTAVVEGSAVIRDGAGDGLELIGAGERLLRRVRGNEIAMIFQEPLSCLNPLKRVGTQIAEGLRVHEGIGAREADARAIELMDLVRIPDARGRSKQYPHQLSGGMRQRIMIAMALACRPRVLIADEPTTALDVTVQAQVLQLIGDLRDELDMAVLFITHDMGVVAEIADEVVVMKQSRVVETGDVFRIFAEPEHAYTRALLRAVPVLGAMAGTSSPRRFDLDGGQA